MDCFSAKRVAPVPAHYAETSRCRHSGVETRHQDRKRGNVPPFLRLIGLPCWIAVDHDAKEHGVDSARVERFTEAVRTILAQRAGRQRAVQALLAALGAAPSCRLHSLR